MLHFGIIDGKRMTCWECQRETRDLAWYTSEEGINIVCQDCIAKIFAEIGLNWNELKPDGF